MACKSLTPGQQLAALPVGMRARLHQCRTRPSVAPTTVKPRQPPSFIAAKRWEPVKQFPIKAVSSDAETEAEYMAGIDSGEFDDVIGAHPLWDRTSYQKRLGIRSAFAHRSPMAGML